MKSSSDDHIYWVNEHSSYGRYFSNVGDNVVDPASSFVIPDQQSMISSGGIPQAHGLWFDLMHHIPSRWTWEQVPICAGMTGILKHQCEGVELYPSSLGQIHAKWPIVSIMLFKRRVKTDPCSMPFFKRRHLLMFATTACKCKALV